MITIIRRVFFVAAFNFYDDKYGFEPAATCSSAFDIAQKVHWWLGAQFDQKKLQLCKDPTILGVTYDLVSMELKIKQSRKIELLDEISSILSSQVFPPGQAGKLRGKLMFGSSQLWGKIGRAFLGYAAYNLHHTCTLYAEPDGMGKVGPIHRSR